MMHVIIVDILFCVLLGTIIYLIHRKNVKKYTKSKYYEETQIEYSAMRKDKGKRGEYATSTYLEKIETEDKYLLFNSYIPKRKNEASEIDIILLTRKGIFVIENKNYSGWIFGDEERTKWCETFKSSKNFFYNPILQNRTHIKYLRKFIGEERKIPYISVITFNNHADLRDITVKSQDTFVIYSAQLTKKINDILKTLPEVLSKEEAESIYHSIKSIKPSEEVKNAHVEQIQKKYKRKNS